MSIPRGRRVPLSPARRVITDLMWACHGTPTVTAERRMQLADLVAARRSTHPAPMWAVVIAKAFAVAAADEPALRQSYVSFPRAHLYEHAEPSAAVVVEYEHSGEKVIGIATLRRPHLRSLAELDGALRQVKDAPAASAPGVRRMLRLARLPRPLRRLALWVGLHASGRMRERNAGTFGLTSIAAAGAGMVQLISPLTATLHYGLFEADGALDVRLTFDHRVFDGAVAARALAAMEQTLRGSILDELRAAGESRHAA